ncbi:hypothetical protein ACFSKN_02070 [Mariniflexile gromovii]|uniref:Uncharacterized protein n=1 Tax=Mariniflexile gromovii TaxID=362523 RepID=A0ABS4BP72_9FLAO|nr:hypothetical protein [Mariniflexile gromovii]MBP0902388.1 hypothetical protein [Mariniflexile gromovii]
MDFGSVNNLQTYGGGQLTTSPMLTGISGLLSGGKVDAASLASTAVNTVAGAIPIVGTITAGLKGIIGLDVGAEIGNVLKYGLSSWGASTNPTQELASFEGHVMPLVQAKFTVMDESNVGATIQWLDNYLTFLHTGYTHLLEKHTRASATRKAYEAVQSKIGELRTTYVNDIVSKLKEAGAKVNTSPQNVDFNQLENTFTFPDDRKFDHEHKYNVVQKTYNIVLPVQQTASTPLDDTETEYVNQSGQIVQSKVQEAGSGGALGIAVVGIILAKIFKIF